MALAEVGRSGSANRRGKEVNFLRSTGAAGTSSLVPTLFYVKYDPQTTDGDVAGAPVTAATVQQAADTVTFRVNGNLDPDLAAIDWTSESLVDAVNRVNASKGWIAVFGDHPPQIGAALGAGSGQIVAEQEGLLGASNDDWVPIAFGGTLQGLLGFGVSKFFSGRYGAAGLGGLALPSYLQTPYAYPLDPATNSSEVGRAGGIDASQGEGTLPGRASKFRTFEGDRAAQAHPTSQTFSVKIETLTTDVGVAGATRMVEITDIEGTVVDSVGAAATGILELTPGVLVNGPAWISVRDIAGGAIVDGLISASGIVRIQ